MSERTRHAYTESWMPFEKPFNLPDPMNGGLAATIESRPSHETVADFKRRIYGESYEQKERCERLFAECYTLTRHRGEEFINGVSHIKPTLGIDDQGNVVVVNDAMQQLMSLRSDLLGVSLLFSGDWAVLGARPLLRPVRVGTADHLGYREVRVQVLPDVSETDLLDRRVHVMPSPLKYIPTPDNLKELDEYLAYMKEQQAKDGIK